MLRLYVFRTLNWPVIDKDDSKDLLVSQPAAMADQDANVVAYKIMYRIAQRQLENGISVILDSPLARVELYHQAVETAGKVHTSALGMCLATLWHVKQKWRWGSEFDSKTLAAACICLPLTSARISTLRQILYIVCKQWNQPL